MPAKKAKKQGKIAGVPAKEERGHSTKGMPAVTENRTTTERRVGSGNTRSGAIEAKKAAGQAGK